MKRLLLFATIMFATYFASAQTVPTEEELRQRAAWLKEYETLPDDDARVDSLYSWSRQLFNTETEIILLRKMYDVAMQKKCEEHIIYSLRNIMRCQYNTDYPLDSIIDSYKKVEQLDFKSKEYRRALADAKSYLAYQYIFEGDFIKVYDLANEMLKDFAKVDNYGLMKAHEILSHSYSEIFQDRKALEHAKQALDISTKIGDDYSEALYLCLAVCSFLNNLDEPEDMLTYTNKLEGFIQKEANRKTPRELDYFRSMQHAYAICYYLSKENLDSAKIETEKTMEFNNVELDQTDTRLRNMMIARYYEAVGDPYTAWQYISEEDSVAPLLYLQEQAKVLHTLGWDSRAYELEHYISGRIAWAFDVTFSKQIMEMETRYKLYNLQEEKSNILTTALIVGGIAAFIIILLAVSGFFRERFYAKKVERANNTQKQFLQNMSHELRTPLNAICGFSQLLTDIEMRGMLTNEEIQQYGDIVRGNTDMLSTLVNDILDASDMESGKYHIFLDNCHPNEICRKAIQTVSYRCPEGVKLYYTTDVDDDFEIYSDGQRVQQIIINYLTNAMKHTTEGEIHVHCSTSETPGMLTFSVTDTGVGVPPEKAELIFKRFEKLNIFKQGTGLGLAICRQLATLLGGSVKLDTSYTNGARFIFTHPLKEEKHEA